MNTQDTYSAHTPVLLQETITLLAIHPSDVVVDGTLGGAGHARAILTKLGGEGVYIGIDADAHALERARKSIGEDPRMHYVCGNFRHIAQHIREEGFTKVNKILLDLGLSSDQLENDSGRGFSFLRTEPLLMTFQSTPTSGTLTAWHIVNEWSEESIANVLYGYGEERRARRIARAIVRTREETPIDTSADLATLVANTVGGKGKTHPATRTFQALRIAVNDEFGALEDVLQAIPSILSPQGRVTIISFHSIEDRMVKHVFRDWQKSQVGNVLTKKPITPSKEEVSANKRARSAKLRVFEKTS